LPNFSSTDILKLSERLKRARDRGHPAHFLMGAGCSISAGIPDAAALVRQIHNDYSAQCADLKGDNYNSYGSCMALLSVNERRDLIRPYLQKARINWGTIALSQLVKEGFVDRVLTVNFDLVLESACRLIGLQPAVYDFGVAPGNDPAMIVSPSIIHLHGQSYGLILLNTNAETQRHREKLQPILTDTLRSAPLIVAGYSGSADGIFQTLLKEFEGREPLYWVGYDEEPKPHLSPLFEKSHFQFLGGADFDRFMIELVQSVGCWPPSLFSNPVRHLINELSPIVAYPVMDSESEVDLLGDLRRRLQSLQYERDENDNRKTSLQELFMKGQFNEIFDQFRMRADSEAFSDEDRDIVAWSSIMVGNSLAEQAKRSDRDGALPLAEAAAEKYHAALAIKPDSHDALTNWGNLLSEQAKRASDEEAWDLFVSATEKYQAALAIKPDSDEALNNLGNLLFERAQRIGGDESSGLLAAAAEHYRTALRIKPDKHEALQNWGGLLSEQAEQASGEQATRFFMMAIEKYQAALDISPDKADVLYDWGILLSERASRSSGAEAIRWFAAAAEKYQAALAIRPDKEEALYNWSVLLFEQMKRIGGNQEPGQFGVTRQSRGALRIA
jgi:Tfp pilus assembly protein PilF